MNTRAYSNGDPVIYEGKAWEVYWCYGNGEVEIVPSGFRFGRGIAVLETSIQLDPSRTNRFDEEARALQRA